MGGRDREDTGEIRIVTCNANRLIDDDLMRDAVDEMRQRRVHIVIWTETHFQQKQFDIRRDSRQKWI